MTCGLHSFVEYADHGSVPRNGIRDIVEDVGSRSAPSGGKVKMEAPQPWNDIEPDEAA